jgi:hypothetical protein
MRTWSRVGALALLVLGCVVLTSTAAWAQSSRGTYDPLTLTCLPGGTNFVKIGIKAGASGAPAGFTLQWMSLSDWEANGEAWFASDDPRLCKMSFSGQPSFSGNTVSRWELGAYEERILEIGDLLYDETGVSGALADDGNGNFVQPDCQLKCGVDYVFRAFAHASRYANRSAYSFVSGDGSPNLVEPGEVCGTSTDCGGCTLTQGYWKTHGPDLCHSGNNQDAWRVDLWPGEANSTCLAGTLRLGSVCYTPTQICAILSAPAKGNGLIALAHQLIAAKLNAIVLGANCDQADITAADNLIGSKVIPPAGTATAKPNTTAALVGALDNFNNGLGCAAHCGVPQAKPFGLESLKQSNVRWGTVKARYR